MNESKYNTLIYDSQLYKDVIKKSRKTGRNIMLSLYSFGLLFAGFFFYFQNKSDSTEFPFQVIFIIALALVAIIYSFFSRMNSFAPRIFLVLDLYLLILSLRISQDYYFEMVLISIYPIIAFIYLKTKEASVANWSFFIICILLFYPLHDFFELRDFDTTYFVVLMATFLIISIFSFYSSLDHKAHLKDMTREIFYDHVTGLPGWQLLKLRLSSGDDGFIAIFRICNLAQIQKSLGVEISSIILKSIKDKLKNCLEFRNNEIFKIRGNDFVFFWDNSNSPKEVEWKLKKMMEIFTIFSFRIDENVIYLKGVAGAVPIEGDAINILHHAEYAVELAELKQKPYVLIPNYERPDNYDEYNKPFQMLLDCFEHNRIQLFYQPILDLKSGVLVKVEALVRFFDSCGRNLDIAPILKSTYSTGMNKKLTIFILEQASRWAIVNECDVSVNLGYEDLINSEIIKTSLTILEEFKVMNRVLTLEILESSAILDTDLSFNNLLILRHSGARIAIDDFGTGFANFDRILNLKPDIIKFDGSLIKELPFNEDARYLVSMIKKLALKNGIQTVAEQVESIEILDYVRKFEIDQVQGFLLGKPSPELVFNELKL